MDGRRPSTSERIPPFADRAAFETEWNGVHSSLPPWRRALFRCGKRRFWRQLKRGKFAFSELKEHVIAGGRVVRTCTPEDKVVARLLLQHLRRETELHDHVLGQPGRPLGPIIRTAAQLRRAGLVVAKFDIKSFYPSVMVTPLLGALRSRLSPELLRPVRSRLLSTGFDNLGCGFPLSGMVADLFVSRVDDVLAGCLYAIRYCDDGLIFAQNAEELERKLYEISTRLGNLGLRLHPEKTRLLHQDEEFVFLGYVIHGDGRITAPKVHYQRIEQSRSLGGALSLVARMAQVGGIIDQERLSWAIAGPQGSTTTSTINYVRLSTS